MSQQNPNESKSDDDPQTHSDIFKHAWEQYVKGDYGGAEASFARAISLNSQYAEAYYGLGLALKPQGRTEAAIVAFQKAIELLQADTQQKNPIRGVMLRNLAQAHIRMIQTDQNQGSTE